jgi:hypothetical protein
MQTKASRRMQKKVRKAALPAAMQKKFSPAPDQGQVIVSPVPAMPPMFETSIRTIGYWASSGTNNLEQLEILTNSLLHSWTGGGNNTAQALANIGRSYTKYRVCAYDIRYHAVSRSTSDYLFWDVHSPDDLGLTVASGWSLNPQLVMPKAFFHTLPANTKSPCYQAIGWKKYKLSDVIGNNEYLTSDTYAGTLNSSGVATSPSDLTYCTLVSGLQGGGAQTASNSPLFTVELVQYVQFYDLRY